MVNTTQVVEIYVYKHHHSQTEVNNTDVMIAHMKVYVVQDSANVGPVSIC